MTIIILHYFQTLFLNIRSFTGKFDISAAATYIIFLACVKELILPQVRCWKGGGKHTKLHIHHLLIDYFCEWTLLICWRRIVDFPCWKSSLKEIHLTWGQLFGNHGMLYRVAQNHGKQVLRISCMKFHLLTFQFVVIPHGKRDLSSLPEVGEAAVQISWKWEAVGQLMQSRQGNSIFPVRFSKPAFHGFVRPCTSSFLVNFATMYVESLTWQ